MRMTVLFDVFVLGRSVGRVVDDALADTELNAFDYAMTSMLDGHGPISPARISELTGMPATTVSGVLRRLTDRGFVARRPNPEDGRSHQIVLTDRGRRETDRARTAFGRVVTAIEDRLGDRLHAVRARLQDLDDAVRAVAGVPLRPYRVTPVDIDVEQRLTVDQLTEVHQFCAWIQARDSVRA
jgi:DNA-binding MarR family transcriptional regulator